MKTKIFTLIVVLCPLLLGAQWSNDPTVNTSIIAGSDSYVQPKVVIGSNGESYISWFRENTVDHQFDVYLQHLDINGNKLWDEDGLLVSDHPTDTWTTDYGLAMDKAGNAVIVNRDQRTGMDNIYAWCISAEGDFVWGSEGLALSDDSMEDYSPDVLVDQENNAIVMWEAFPLDTNEFIKTKFQKIGPDGSLLWEDVVIENDSAHCWMPCMINTEDTSTLVIWIETDNDTAHAAGHWQFMFPYMQKINAEGDFVWPEPVQLSIAYDMPLFPFKPSMDSDGEGGAYVAWMGFPDFGAFYTCYAQYIASDGNMRWAQNGVNVTDSTQFLHTDPKVQALTDGEGMIVMWNETRQRSDIDVEVAVMGQRFSMQGERLWSTQGRVIDGFYNSIDTSTMLVDVKPVGYNEGIVFYYHEFIDVIGGDTTFTDYLYARRIDQDAGAVWNKPAVISDNYGELFGLDVSGMGQNQWILVWPDNRNDPGHDFKTDIYAQNMGPEGWIGPLSNDAIVVSDPGLVQVYPNPVCKIVCIGFEMEKASQVEVSIMDITGKNAVNPLTDYKTKGRHEIHFDTSDLLPGVYVLNIKTDFAVCSQRIVKQ